MTKEWRYFMCKKRKISGETVPLTDLLFADRKATGIALISESAGKILPWKNWDCVWTILCWWSWLWKAWFPVTWILGQRQALVWSVFLLDRWSAAGSGKGRKKGVSCIVKQSARLSERTDFISSYGNRSCKGNLSSVFIRKPQDRTGSRQLQGRGAVRCSTPDAKSVWDL